MRMLQAPSKSVGRSHNREITQLSRKVDTISQQIAMLAARPETPPAISARPAVLAARPSHGVADPVTVEVDENEQDEVDLKSMERFGKCAFQLAGAALQLSQQAGSDLSKIAEEGAKQVAKAKECMINNHCEVLNLMEGFGKEIGQIDPEHFANDQWKEIMGKSSDDLLYHCLSTGKWGGIVDLALAVWHTSVEIVVVHADSINAKASDEEVKVAVHPAMLEGLPDGPVEKTVRVFAVLKLGHYHLATIKKGGSEFAVFKIGNDADEAQSLIVEFLKTKQKGPLGQLTKAERRKLIKDTIKDGASWAEVVGRAPAVEQRKAASTADVVDLTKSNTPCRNIEENGFCRFGERCKFNHDDKHDDSRRVRNKRQKKARTSITVVKAKDQQPWQQVPSRERKLEVWCRASVHPASWRTSLQSINAEAYELVTWAERSVAGGEWLTVQCKVGEEDKVAKLLDQTFKIKQQTHRSNGKQRAQHCANFLNGDRCSHTAPYCK